MFRVSTLCLLLLGIAAAMPSAARADSCWDHNGSLMRLQAEGNQRWFVYERPRPGLAQAGVTPGTLLFNGVKDGDWYSGTARVFSAGCEPLEYAVEGPVASDQRHVTVSGERQIYRNCEATGQYTTDVLVFTYVRQC